DRQSAWPAGKAPSTATDRGWPWAWGGGASDRQAASRAEECCWHRNPRRVGAAQAYLPRSNSSEQFRPSTRSSNFGRSKSPVRNGRFARTHHVVTSATTTPRYPPISKYTYQFRLSIDM